MNYDVITQASYFVQKRQKVNRFLVGARTAVDRIVGPLVIASVRIQFERFLNFLMVYVRGVSRKESFAFEVVRLRPKKSFAALFSEFLVEVSVFRKLLLLPHNAVLRFSVLLLKKQFWFAGQND